MKIEGPAIGGDIRQYPSMVCVKPARQQTGPCGTAQGRGHKRIGEQHAAFDEFFLHHGHGPERIPALIVGENEDNIRGVAQRRLDGDLDRGPEAPVTDGNRGRAGRPP